jgi:hypothetical protein
LRIPSGPAVMRPRQQAGHMDAFDPQPVSRQALEPQGPFTHGINPYPIALQRGTVDDYGNARPARGYRSTG